MLDTIIPGRCEVELERIAEGSVHLVATSPPYNVNLDYGNGYNDNMPEHEYYAWVEKWLSQCFRVLCVGGKIAVNIPVVGNVKQGKSKGLQTYVDKYLYALRKVGFTPREMITWVKGKREFDEMSFSGSSTAWGSWCSANDPMCRSFSEMILVAHKISSSQGRHGYGDITADEFKRYTRNVWTFPAESKRKNGHPAPFPEELPYRLIKLYTYPGDVVLDPCSGRGTTALVAAKTGRHFIGIEQNPEYVKASLQRINEVIMERGIETYELAKIEVAVRQEQTILVQ
jgi:DNA modification methylase